MRMATSITSQEFEQSYAFTSGACNATVPNSCHSAVHTSFNWLKCHLS